MRDPNQTWGTLTNMGPVDFPSPLRCLDTSTSEARERYVWRPGLELEDEVGPTFGLSLLCDTSASGMRRFLPYPAGNQAADAYVAFFTSAWSSGFGIRCRQNPDEFTPDVRNSYRVMWFLFQRAQTMRQFVQRSFRSVKDLKIVPSAREARGEDHILPWPIDDNTAAIGYPQSIDGLLDLGAIESARIGNRKPLVADKIHNGLAATARLEPHQTLSKEESARLIQSVLFDVGDVPEELNSELERQIEAHILEEIWPHLDSRTRVFDDWFWGRSNSFIKQVARKLKNYEGKLAQEMTRHVLLRRGWKAYGYIGECVHVLMRDVEKGLADSLSPAERTAFEMLYYPQDFLGGLPLVMLGKKLDFVSGVVQDLLARPHDARTVQALHRLLFFYVRLVQERRSADRRSSTATGSSPSFIEYDDDKHAPLANDSQLAIENADVLKVLYERVRNQRQIECACDNPKWEGNFREMHRRNAVLEFRCHGCNQSPVEVTISIDELERIGAQL